MSTGQTLQRELVERLSRFPFAITVERIAALVQAEGMTVFARIDHAAAAKASGQFMPPTIVLIYGNALAGTPIMLEAPAAALDLPLRVLVREDEHGRVCIAFHPIVAVLTRAGVTEEMATRLGPAQDLLVEAIRS